MNVNGKIIQIAGSAGRKSKFTGGVIPFSRIVYAHILVKEIVDSLYRKGANFLIQVGGEPALDERGQKISGVFDWTIAEKISTLVNSAQDSVVRDKMSPLYTVTSQRAIEKIPESRETLWKLLVEKSLIEVHLLPQGVDSGAARRSHQARVGDILIVVSGGEGVEHLANEYVRLGKTVIPLDIDVGSSSGDGNGGGSYLWKKMLSCSSQFFETRNEASCSSILMKMRTKSGTSPPFGVANAISDLLDNLVPPTVFYVRLLDQRNEEFQDVENFFREVVDPFVVELGFSKKEMGSTENRNFWLNEEIFEGINKSTIQIVDLTGNRGNCLVEFGFVLALGRTFVLSAKKGTKLPFDLSTVDCFFWDNEQSSIEKKRKLVEYWKRNRLRSPIIKVVDRL
ncbi:MAG: hypothetical protein ACYDCP_03295 [Thermoplasmataceae archaeon]|jgi:hypothetical protein